MSVYHVCSQYPWRSEKNISFRTDVMATVSHYVDAGNRTWVLCKNKCSLLMHPLSLPLSHSLALLCAIYSWTSSTRKISASLHYQFTNEASISLFPKTSSLFIHFKARDMLTGCLYAEPLQQTIHYCESRLFIFPKTQSVFICLGTMYLLLWTWGIYGLIK